MAKKPSHVRWVIALALVLLVGRLVYSSLQQMRVRYEVCVTFRGASHCATAAGATYEQAVSSAQEIDCHFLAGSRDEEIACSNLAPSSVRRLK